VVEKVRGGVSVEAAQVTAEPGGGWWQGVEHGTAVMGRKGGSAWHGRRLRQGGSKPAGGSGYQGGGLLWGRWCTMAGWVPMAWLYGSGSGWIGDSLRALYALSDSMGGITLPAYGGHYGYGGYLPSYG